jgi:hypothetical protein
LVSRAAATRGGFGAHSKPESAFVLVIPSNDWARRAHRAPDALSEDEPRVLSQLVLNDVARMDLQRTLAAAARQSKTLRAVAA